MDKIEKDLAIYVGEKIKFFRKQKKMTQKELGVKISKSDNTISNYEKGIIAPSQDALFALAEALDIKVDDLFPERDNSESLHHALLDSKDNLAINDMLFLKQLMEYIETLDENSRKQLLGNIEIAVELFKKQH
ncbi:helix-turn-helix domain-containing protein [Lysinibacillus pakistanensis]|uniref:Helix-turn-helix domain-containing protein n=1 Tax=Lysinibacillus pakistanensis TaxID=759811 RepID=A0AAX3WWL6_9BACI|nr:helix-turn-helix domain-containing protein [Lysinibacillus pakistanensis]MDM5231440.1 helix-turn-helix domain-containing protein [Lysinibacillus pakistanensis]WHY46987.1 helix-turn-helix domain-containing protein [Lysinibacillus pakistanensis]WHY51999.1 helix-turn-helix domain-containing protein [Lysinibacillus pakistanensis]